MGTYPMLSDCVQPCHCFQLYAVPWLGKRGSQDQTLLWVQVKRKTNARYSGVQHPARCYVSHTSPGCKFLWKGMKPPPQRCIHSVLSLGKPRSICAAASTKTVSERRLGINFLLLFNSTKAE